MGLGERGRLADGGVETGPRSMTCPLVPRPRALDRQLQSTSGGAVGCSALWNFSAASQGPRCLEQPNSQVERVVPDLGPL